MTDFPAENRTAQNVPQYARGDEQGVGSEPPPVQQQPAPVPAAQPAPQQRLAAVVRGRIDVADEVVEKVAGLAATEVEGVADLGGDFERALESVRERIGIGQKRGDQGVKAKISGREVAIDVTIMIEYGHVVMDVAR
ncbi:MAG TPA: Asp23/Gls24 family envelope stress response protein, partial [Acidimicrobiales bacterium]